MSNRLATETSPCLLQHADNPVDWYPWGAEAFEAARARKCAVLLSVGYSACHWCHVMAHESFEDVTIAALMNRLFVNVKVDREERPDVDSVYMQAVQAMSGRGGWPMTVFLTSDGLPFFGGTYFPPSPRHGMPAFPEVLQAVHDAHQTRPDAVAHTSHELVRAITPVTLRPGDSAPSVEHLEAAAQQLIVLADDIDGGFGEAPKFPHSAAIEVLLRHRLHTGDEPAWRVATLTLDRMARGGLCDQLGGGFHRYSVDGQWGVPHFEKMLYDNAQLAIPFLHAFQLGAGDDCRLVVESTLTWMLREMRLPDGGFASSQDADSEGVEGRYFVWTPSELRDALGEDDGNFAALIFGVNERGNAEGGATVLSLPQPLTIVATTLGEPESVVRQRVDHIRRRLFDERSRRTVPTRDDKVVTSWNALAIRALAECGFALGNSEWIDAARRCADFLLTSLRSSEGSLLRTWRAGEAKVPGFLEDHAFLADALLVLHEATGESRWLDEASLLADRALHTFWVADDGWYDVSADSSADMSNDAPLAVRPRTIDDNPIPAGQSVMARVLLRLHALTGEGRYVDLAEATLTSMTVAIARSPLAFASLAEALELLVRPVRGIALVGAVDHPSVIAFLGVLRARFRPDTVVTWGGSGVALVAERPLIDGRPAAYVCTAFACRAPLTDPAHLAVELESAGVPAR